MGTRRAAGPAATITVARQAELMRRYVEAWPPAAPLPAELREWAALVARDRCGIAAAAAASEALN